MIQTRDPQIAKALAKLPDCHLAGYAVAGGYLKLFALPYALGWVGRNVIDKLTLKFPRKIEGSKTETPSPDALRGRSGIEAKEREMEAT